MTAEELSQLFHFRDAFPARAQRGRRRIPPQPPEPKKDLRRTDAATPLGARDEAQDCLRPLRRGRREPGGRRPLLRHHQPRRRLGGDGSGRRAKVQSGLSKDQVKFTASLKRFRPLLRDRRLRPCLVPLARATHCTLQFPVAINMRRRIVLKQRMFRT